MLGILKAVLVGSQVGESEGDVLHQDVQVVGALAIGQAGMDLACFGIHQVGLDLVAVAPKERVGE